MAVIDARSDNSAMSGANNQLQGPPAGATYADVTAGNQGETFVRNFLKMDQVKRDLRDKKEEKNVAKRAYKQCLPTNNPKAIVFLSEYNWLFNFCSIID